MFWQKNEAHFLHAALEKIDVGTCVSLPRRLIFLSSFLKKKGKMCDVLVEQSFNFHGSSSNAHSEKENNKKTMKKELSLFPHTWPSLQAVIFLL